MQGIGCPQYLNFVTKVSGYNLEHPGKKTFPLKENLFLLIARWCELQEFTSLAGREQS